MYYKLYRRRFILLGIWVCLMILLILIWLINYFIINILLYCIIFIVCAGVLLIKLSEFWKIINDHKKILFLANSLIIIIIIGVYYDFIIFNVIFVICDLIILIKIYYILFKQHSKFSFLRRG